MPVTIGRVGDGITIDAVLKPAVTWRGRLPGGTRVVLKKLSDDCLRAGRLHPAIALRLTRLREAPVGGLATLIGVERLDVGVCTVSEFIRGRPLDALPLPARAAHLPAARGLVEALHRVGLVHGAIGPGNFVVGAGGRLRLIDPSPLLYDDFDVDLVDLIRMEPDTEGMPVERPARRVHWPSLGAAAAVSAVAAVGAIGWARHLAGRP